MSECQFCKGAGEISEKKVHFGDGQPRTVLCPVCQGTGKVDIDQTHKRTIIKPHGVWGTGN